MAKITSKVKVKTPIFNTNLGVYLVILAQICDGLSCGQSKFPKILIQKGQNDLEGQGQ